MDERDLPPKPRRRTTTRMVGANLVASWSFLAFVAYHAPNGLEAVTWPIAFIIVGLIGAFTGTGHMDLRELTRFAEAKGGGSRRPPPFSGRPPPTESAREEDDRRAG